MTTASWVLVLSTHPGEISQKKSAVTSLYSRKP